MAVRQPRVRVEAPRRPPWQSRYHGVRMTPEQYLALPEEKPYLEYIDGMVVQKPMVNSEHRKLVGKLDFAFGLYQQSHGGTFGPEGRVRAGAPATFRIPDTAYWAPGLPSGDDSLPTLAVEVRSPGQTAAELRAKCRFFRRNGVEACWLVDPEARTVEVFEGGQDGAVLADPATLMSAHLPGFVLPLRELFAVLAD